MIIEDLAKAAPDFEAVHDDGDFDSEYLEISGLVDQLISEVDGPIATALNSTLDSRPAKAVTIFELQGDPLIKHFGFHEGVEGFPKVHVEVLRIDHPGRIDQALDALTVTIRHKTGEDVELDRPPQDVLDTRYKSVLLFTIVTMEEPGVAKKNFAQVHLDENGVPLRGDVSVVMSDHDDSDMQVQRIGGLKNLALLFFAMNRVSTFKSEERVIPLENTLRQELAFQFLS